MEFWIAAALAAYLLGLSKGGVPVIAILSVPLMSLFMDPALAAGLLLPLYVLSDCYAIYLFRKAFSVRNLKILLPAAAGGILIGYNSVSILPENLVKLLVAIIGASYLANLLYKRLTKNEPPKREADVPRGVFWGALAGLTSYISHAGGPPYQTYVLPQKLDKMVYLGTTTILFTAINLMKVPPYILAGQITWTSFLDALWLAPFALLGAWSGSVVIKSISERLFYLIIEIALGIVSLKLFYDVFFG
ncbi:sulfite exporter TauE/SafE family protein [Cognatishimia activa]|uniref:sulfite exporter TauE/SafE family protein n=1 Tax=Cognatishimia activa TaxID=1715691 RepID=UPI00222EC6D5|nr:sulfite exporter TauE/SafE family protein [Cognatishimia activa]UZD90902.1 sulfite exporter TauE/SafE family protein [Cognatishimia activa]